VSAAIRILAFHLRIAESNAKMSKEPYGGYFAELHKNRSEIRAALTKLGYDLEAHDKARMQRQQ
jgi:hypothetical protein